MKIIFKQKLIVCCLIMIVKTTTAQGDQKHWWADLTNCLGDDPSRLARPSNHPYYHRC